MSQITRGRLRASQIRVRLEGVWVHVEEVVVRERRAGVERVGVSGGEAVRSESRERAALAVRVVRLVGEGLAGVLVSEGGSKSRGWFLVATMVEVCYAIAMAVLWDINGMVWEGCVDCRKGVSFF